MAYVKDNIFTSGASGTVDNKMNFRIRKGKTIMGVKRGPNTKPPSEKQLAVQERFLMASLYAQGAMKDPLIKALYQKAAKGGQTAFNVALKDAANLPVINDVNIRNYKGTIGDLITVKVRDVITPKSVTVAILSQAGVELEQGNAVLNTTDKTLWAYTVTAANATLTGTRIVVTATDLPGNSAEKETMIS